MTQRYRATGLDDAAMRLARDGASTMEIYAQVIEWALASAKLAAEFGEDLARKEAAEAADNEARGDNYELGDDR